MKRTKKSTEAKKKRRNGTEMTRMMRTQAGQSQDRTQVVARICVTLRSGFCRQGKKEKEKGWQNQEQGDNRKSRLCKLRHRWRMGQKRVAAVCAAALSQCFNHVNCSSGAVTVLHVC